eukprot:gene11552-13485_t
MFTMETRHQFHQKFQRFRQLLLDAPENMEYVHLVMDQTSDSLLFGGFPIYQWLFDRANHSLGFDLSGLRYAFSGGIVLPVDLRRLIYERYGFNICQNYGATETGVISIDIYPNIEKYSSNRIYVAPFHEYKTVAHPFGGLELCLRSDVCLVYGYITSGVKVQPIVDDEGWYHTGDLVEFVQDLDSPNNQVMLYLRRIKIARNTLIGDLDLYKIQQSVLSGFKVNALASIKGPKIGCLTSSSTSIDPKITIGAFLGTMTQALYISNLLQMTPNDVSYVHSSIGFGYVFGAFPIYKWFMDQDVDGLGFDLSGLRYAFSGGIVLPVELRRSICQKYGLHIFQIYGATETGVISLDIYPNIEKYSSNRIYVAPCHEYKTVEHPLGGFELCLRSDVCLVSFKI